MNNTIIIYFLLSFLILFFFTKVSYSLNLVDIPNKRKIHSKATAYTGGISISIILLIALQTLNIFDKTLGLILSIGFLISVVGLIDDKYHLNTGGKLSLQILPIFYLIVFENLALFHIGEYNYFKLDLGSFSVPFTLLSVLFLTNAFNYFDGLDGTLGFTTISVLGILYFLTPDRNFQIFLIMIIIPLIIFLLFNFSFFKLPKLFLGDSGSLLLGFIVSFILIYLSSKNYVHPIILAWSVVIFVYEFLSVNLIRLKNKHYLFKASQDHLHHILIQKTDSVFLTNMTMTLTNIILFLIGFFSFIFINKIVSLILFIVLFLIYLFIRNFYLSIKMKR